LYKVLYDEKSEVLMRILFYDKRIVIDVTERIHKKVKKLAAEQQLSIRAFVLQAIYAKMELDNQSKGDEND